MRRVALVALCLVLAPTLALSQSFTLDFNAPVPGTLTDAIGVGTGFTTRLPGTGSTIPINDPNLAVGCGVLSITSTLANYAPTLLLDGLEAPCVPWTLPPSSDIALKSLTMSRTATAGSATTSLVTLLLRCAFARSSEAPRRKHVRG